MRKKQQSDYVRTALRLPPALHKSVHESAKVAGRTFNAELVQRLEQTFADETEKQLIGAILSMQGKLDELLATNRDKSNVIDLIAKLEGRVKRPESAEKGRKRTK